VSTRAVSAVFEHSQSYLASRLVMLVIAEAASNDGISWPGRAKIAKRAGISEEHVSRCLQELACELREIEIRHYYRGRVRHNAYRIRLPGLNPIDYTRLDQHGICLALRFTDEVTDVDVVTEGRGDNLSCDEVTDRHFSRARPKSGTVSRNRKGASANALARWSSSCSALADACSIRPQLLAASSPLYDAGLARDLRVATFKIRGKAQGLSDEELADEIRLRARAYSERWPDIELTPFGLAKNWNRVVTPRPGPTRIDDAEIGRLLEEQGLL